MFEISTELKTFELNILNSDRLINLEESKHYSISRLRKRVDQKLIPISTIQKFLAQDYFMNYFIYSTESPNKDFRLQFRT